MAGAFTAAWVQSVTGSFLLGIPAAVAVTAALGAVLEFGLFRRFYGRSHLDQVLVTFGIVLVANELTRIVFGPVPLRMPLPPVLAGSIEILPGLPYPTFRLVVLAVGLAVAGLLWAV